MPDSIDQIGPGPQINNSNLPSFFTDGGEKGLRRRTAGRLILADQANLNCQAATVDIYYRIGFLNLFGKGVC